MNMLDQKGYFEFFAEAGNIVDNIITHYKPEDVRELSNNIVNIIDTVRLATQPELMAAINNGVKIYSSIETENIPEYSIFKVMKEMNNVIDLIEINNLSSEASDLYNNIKNKIDKKVELLDHQLDLINKKSFSADKVFELNKKYNLSDKND